MILYFNYGSNMSTDELKDHVDASCSMQILGAAYVEGYRVEYQDLLNVADKKLNIVKAPGHVCWGTLLCMDMPCELHELYRKEGLYNKTPLYYIETLPEVTLHKGSKVYKNVKVFKVHKSGMSNRTNKPVFVEYKDKVLRGAREHGLPEWYIQEYLNVSAIRGPSRVS